MPSKSQGFAFIPHKSHTIGVRNPILQMGQLRLREGNCLVVQGHRGATCVPTSLGLQSLDKAQCQAVPPSAALWILLTSRPSPSPFGEAAAPHKEQAQCCTL